MSAKKYCTERSCGFTLIELLVVISIISILSVVGFVAYQNVTSKAKDAKMKADIDSIKKAYETNYDPSANSGQGGYKPLSDNQFASGKIPTPPGGGSYQAYLGPQGPIDSPSLPGQNQVTSLAYKVCAILSNNTNACASSTQGDTSLVTQVNSLSNSSCDPTSSLALGLVGYWKMDEGSGTTATDSSGNHNTGSLSPNVSWVPITDNPNFKNAVFINNGAISLSNLPITASFSLSAWVNFNGTDFNNWINIFCNNQILLRKDVSTEGNKISAFVHLNDGTYEPRVSSLVPSVNTFYHVVETWDGQSLALYVNGQSYGTSSRSGTLATQSTPVIGCGASYFNIDDVRVYNRILTPTEIQLLYGNRTNACL